MTIDARNLIDKDRRLPETLTGDQGKLLVVNAGETAYEHVTSADSRITGEIIMWPLDAAPAGYLTCDGLEYATATYPALSALLGESSAGFFRTPAITFVKNSVGANTLDAVAESVGTHGHTASSTAAHTHTVTVSSQASHGHSVSISGGSHTHTISSGHPTSSGSSYDIQRFPTGTANITGGDHGHSVSVGENGAHTHTATTGSAGAVTPSITNHTGVNQPAHTLIHFCIKT